MTVKPVGKERADRLLVNQGRAESRERAAAFIMAGSVFCGPKKITKPAELVPGDVELFVKMPDHPYVSRGGVKLANALRVFDLPLVGKTAMDVGASTGGFTDCMLQRGVVKVYAVDCGYNQLDWKLRNHPAVINLEKHNFRHLAFETIGEQVDLITVDLSFISLKLIKMKLFEFIKPSGDLLMLVKPQFEAGKNMTDKGMVKDEHLRKQILSDVTADYATHFRLLSETSSGLPGKKKKNEEHFVHFKPIES